MIKDETEENLAQALKEAQTEINALADTVAHDWLHAKLKTSEKEKVVAVARTNPISEILGYVDD
tara:strand:+ start:1497 stop:1688 length:192 start_codon:yes stop_codon:yes gene_type:complete